jgi:hypothetical protein
MEEKQISEKESLEIITRMIQSAKSSISDSSIYYLLWGWLVFIALLSEYFLTRINWPYYFIGWMILMPAGFVAASVIGIRRGRKRGMKTYIDQFMSYLWSGFVISLLIVLSFMQKINADGIYPVIFVLYGLGTFVSGGVLRFRPLQIGGIICWSVAVASIYVEHNIQLLMGAILMIVAYIIPGYLLRTQFKKQQVTIAAS